MSSEPAKSGIGIPSELPLRSHSVANEVSVAPMDPVERVVFELNAICKTATLDFAVSVGSLIIARFYGGRLDSWRQRGTKDASLRKLAAHPNLPMSAVSLYRSIAIYEVIARLEVKTWKYLSTSHIRTVLPLPSDVQDRLLRSAEASRWTVMELERQVQSLRPLKHRGGRLRHTGLEKTTRALEKCLTVCNALTSTLDDSYLSVTTAMRLQEKIKIIHDLCAKLENRIADVLK